jgi:hypothetical protein
MIQNQYESVGFGKLKWNALYASVKTYELEKNW